MPILIVQHPDESSHPFTTSYLASLGASSVGLCCALDFTELQCRSLLQVGSVDELALLYVDHHYDEHDTITIDCLNPDLYAALGDISGLLVLDGTWRNTRELLLRNPWLTTITTLSLKNLDKSEYTIRKGTDDTVCTIEAIATILSMLCPNFERETYLRPMRELVCQQNEFQTRSATNTGPRH